MFKLNETTEHMLLTTNRTKHLHNLLPSITIASAKIAFKQSGRSKLHIVMLSCY